MHYYCNAESAWDDADARVANTRPIVAEQQGGDTPSRREFEELEQYAETIRDDMITMREEAELLRSLSTWNYDMSTAPKDRPILGLCRHDADPYHDEATGRLTDYGCSAEGMGRVQDGPHVLVWGGGDSDYDEWAQKTISWPDWWFRFGSEFEEAANPIAWMAIPEMP